MELQQIVAFILEIDKLKGVTRKIRLRGAGRYENSAEHSWQLAMLAMPLARFADPGTDLDRVIRMLLVHDVGEIDIGDTMAFAQIDWKAHKVTEQAAAERIFSMLPEPERSGLLELWVEFERAETAEARFANAIDRAMPVLLNLANDGQSWRENDISYDRVIARVEPPIKSGCPALWEYLEPRLREHFENR